MKPNTCFVIDVWEGQLDINEDIMHDNDVAGIIIRLNDMNGGHHMDENFFVQWDQAESFVRAPYFVYNPWVTGEENFLWMVAHIPIGVRVVAVDVEVVYPGYSPSVYAHEVQKFCDMCSGVGIKLLNYTGYGFLNLLSVWPNMDYWWAQYPDFNFYFPNCTTWDQLKTDLDKLDKPFNLNKVPGTLKMWQFGGDFPIMPGSTRKIDINIFYGTKAELAEYFQSFPDDDDDEGETTMGFKVGLDLDKDARFIKTSELIGNVDFVLAKAAEVDDRVLDNWGTKDSVDQFINPDLVDICQKTWDAGAALVPFIVDNPGYKTEWVTIPIYTDEQDPQIRALVQALAHKTYHAIAVKIARYWLRTDEYLAVSNGEQDSKTLRILGPNSILDSARDTVARIERAQKAKKLLNVPIWVYTGTWFINAYCKDLDTFFGPKIKWIVAPSKVDPIRAYMRSSFVATLKTWPQLRSAVDTININAPLPNYVGNKPNDAQQLTDQVIGKGLGVYSDPECTVPAKFGLDRILNSDWSNILDIANINDVDKPEPTPDPEPEPEPTPEPTATYYVQIRPWMTTLKLRTSPDSSFPTNIVDNSFAATGPTSPSIVFPISGEPILDAKTGITWAPLGPLFFAVSQGATIYADVTKIVK